MKAELERCKRKAGGKRKLEQVYEEGGPGKIPKLKKENNQEKKILEIHQEIKNPENRIKKEDDLKEKSEASEVTNN